MNWDVKVEFVWKAIRFCGTLGLQDVDRLSIIESYPGHTAALASTAPQNKPQWFLTQNSEAQRLLHKYDDYSAASTPPRPPPPYHSCAPCILAILKFGGETQKG